MMVPAIQSSCHVGACKTVSVSCWCLQDSLLSLRCLQDSPLSLWCLKYSFLSLWCLQYSPRVMMVPTILSPVIMVPAIQSPVMLVPAKQSPCHGSISLYNEKQVGNAYYRHWGQLGSWFRVTRTNLISIQRMTHITMSSSTEVIVFSGIYCRIPSPIL